LAQIVILSESMRKKFSEQLRFNTSKLEAVCNQNYNYEMRSQMSGHAISYMQEQFKILYKAIDNISVDKKHGERLQQSIE